MNLLPLSPLQIQALSRGASAVRVPMEPQPECKSIIQLGEIFVDEADPSWRFLPPFKPGDVVAIGEEWQVVEFALIDGNQYSASLGFRDGSYVYRDLNREQFMHLQQLVPEPIELPWQPASTMPVEFARHFRVIGDVRAVRCQDIDYDTCDALTGTTSENAAKFPCPTKMTLEMHGLEYHNSNPFEWQYELKEMKGGAA